MRSLGSWNGSGSRPLPASSFRIASNASESPTSSCSLEDCSLSAVCLGERCPELALLLGEGSLGCGVETGGAADGGTEACSELGVEIEGIVGLSSPGSIGREIATRLRRSIGHPPNTDRKSAAAVAITKRSENQVKTSAGIWKLLFRSDAKLANTTRTVIRANMMTAPKRATRKSMLKPLRTIAITAMTPPTPSAYFTAGTALIACFRKDGGVTKLPSGIRKPLTRRWPMLAILGGLVQ